MSTDLLYFAADVVALIGRLSWWLLVGSLWGLLGLVVLGLYVPRRPDSSVSDWEGGA